MFRFLGLDARDTRDKKNQDKKIAEPDVSGYDSN
jgi:hypothetical protein